MNVNKCFKQIDLLSGHFVLDFGIRAGFVEGERDATSTKSQFCYYGRSICFYYCVGLWTNRVDRYEEPTFWQAID
jgi:hypothetical protein